MALVAQMSTEEDGSLLALWQRKVLLASQYVLSGNNDVDETTDYFSIYSSDSNNNNNYYMVDNTSNRCAAMMRLNDEQSADCSFCCEQTTAVLLQWTRILFYKIARTYMAAPLLLALLPLSVGLLLGLWTGTRCERTPRQQPRSTRRWNVVETETSGVAWTFVGRLSSLHRYILPFVQRRGESLEDKENRVRTDLKSDANTKRESGVKLEDVPKHVAVIMDGNRRYGKARYGSVAKGHWDGSKTLIDFAKWCTAEGIQVLTVYAFSTENWNRDASEVAALMDIFVKYCDELRVEALERNIRIHVLSTDSQRIPSHVQDGLRRMEEETKHCDNGLTMNVCLSYGSRGEIVNACRALAVDAKDGVLLPEEIDDSHFQAKLLTRHCTDPDVVIRTSGEYRLSNFLLWQLAYTEMFFIPKQWPELEKRDLLNVIQTYASGRRRRFGK